MRPSSPAAASGCVPHRPRSPAWSGSSPRTPPRWGDDAWVVDSTPVGWAAPGRPPSARTRPAWPPPGSPAPPPPPGPTREPCTTGATSTAPRSGSPPAPTPGTPAGCGSPGTRTPRPPGRPTRSPSSTAAPAPRRTTASLHSDVDGYDLGQWQESGRDHGHSLLGTGQTGALCEMAWNQATDLYRHDSRRFLKAAQYLAKYGIGRDAPVHHLHLGHWHQPRPAVADRHRVRQPGAGTASTPRLRRRAAARRSCRRQGRARRRWPGGTGCPCCPASDEAGPRPC